MYLKKELQDIVNALNFFFHIIAIPFNACGEQWHKLFYEPLPAFPLPSPVPSSTSEPSLFMHPCVPLSRLKYDILKVPSQRNAEGGLEHLLNESKSTLVAKAM